MQCTEQLSIKGGNGERRENQVGQGGHNMMAVSSKKLYKIIKAEVELAANWN